MGGPYLWLKGRLGPAVEGAGGVTVDWPWSHLVSRNSPVAGQDTSPNGRVSGFGSSRAWVVFEPLPLPATERVGPGIGI